jgi:hypothetical protein
MQTFRNGYVAWIGMAALLVAGVGCSSSSGGGGSCASVAGCGGNLVGTWKITSSCSTGSMMTMNGSTCPGETLTPESSNEAGTITFNSDGTYSSSINESGTETVFFPASCVSMLGNGLTCAQVASQLNSAGGMAGAGLMETFSCTGSGSCTCNVNVTISGSATGTYTTSGASVTSMPSGSTGGTVSYCVQGNTLTMSGGSSMMGAAMPAGNLVLTKQ